MPYVAKARLGAPSFIALVAESGSMRIGIFAVAGSSKFTAADVASGMPNAKSPAPQFERFDPVCADDDVALVDGLLLRRQSVNGSSWMRLVP